MGSEALFPQSNLGLTEESLSMDLCDICLCASRLTAPTGITMWPGVSHFSVLMNNIYKYRNTPPVVDVQPIIVFSITSSTNYPAATGTVERGPTEEKKKRQRCERGNGE